MEIFGRVSSWTSGKFLMTLPSNHLASILTSKKRLLEEINHHLLQLQPLTRWMIKNLLRFWHQAPRHMERVPTCLSTRENLKRVFMSLTNLEKIRIRRLSRIEKFKKKFQIGSRAKSNKTIKISSPTLNYSTKTSWV